MNVTAKTLTVDRINRLRDEAYQAGDHMMGAICDLALQGKIDTDDYTVLSRTEMKRLDAMSRDEAYAEIAQAIRNAGG